MPVMHFQEAVREHNEWWLQFEQYLHSNAGELAFEDVMHDDSCAIGKWLHGEGQKFAHLTELQHVMTYHRKLHEVAGRARQAKIDGEDDVLQALIDELLGLRHKLFKTWSALNDYIGALD